MFRKSLAVVVGILGVLVYAIVFREPDEPQETKAELCYETGELTVCAKSARGCYFPDLACIERGLARAPNVEAMCISFFDGPGNLAEFAVGTSAVAVKSLDCANAVDSRYKFECI